MPFFQKARNFLRACVQTRGTKNLKKKLWDKEFAEGVWDYIESTENDCIYPIVERYLGAGSILDLGCGSGNTGNELRDSAYKLYTGVDISSVALERARLRSQKSGRGNKNEYFQSDIYSFQPQRTYDLILFRESIFYVPTAQIRSMLVRYAEYLAPGKGVFVVRMYHRERCAAITQLIAENFRVVEEFLPHNVTTIVLVFR